MSVCWCSTPQTQPTMLERQRPSTPHQVAAIHAQTPSTSPTTLRIGPRAARPVLRKPPPCTNSQRVSPQMTHAALRVGAAASPSRAILSPSLPTPCRTTNPVTNTPCGPLLRTRQPHRPPTKLQTHLLANNRRRVGGECSFRKGVGRVRGQVPEEGHGGGPGGNDSGGGSSGGSG